MTIRFLTFAVLLTLLPMSYVWAQNAVNVRVGEHSDYTRLVFDWPQKVEFNVVEQRSDSITVEFEKSAELTSNVRGKNIKGFELVQKDPLRVKIVIPEGARTRSFPLSTRVVVDVYKNEQMSAQSKSAPPPQEMPALPKPEVEQVKMPDDNDLSSVKEALEKVDGLVADVLNEEERRVETSSNLEQAAVSEPPGASESPKADNIKDIADNEVNPHKLSLSATQSIGMAVFSSFGQLVMVTDKPDLFVRPQITGPNTEYFQPIEEKSIDGGKAYITKTMPRTYLRGQGGGLLWNVLMMAEGPSEDDDSYSPIEPNRVGVRPNGGAARSGKIVWPLKSARRVLDIVDPASGSLLKVVTVEDAKDFVGGTRQFVDFDVLSSPIGLTIRPKSEGLSVDITSEGVEISRVGGLAILPQKQVAAVEKESFEDRMSRSPEDRRIFNFSEWRMGGLEALNENENIILASMPSMTKSTQIENLITLAKMKLSNGRGAEALGFLEYAQRELPELVQNPEFLSLRGVAKAFSWKTEEAFRDLSSPILEDYEEIQIWRAFSLADLGDWQQAREVMPTNLAPLDDYPPEVLNRLGVVLAEIFLRSGDIRKAERLFDLKDDDDLNLANAAALKYLEGEAARQKGDVDETKELWKELTEGPDDLYRVKAGLALTRLLMQEKSISSQDAVDRLERLRYAWRGDELEAQINYWLGRTYFENEDYVKGLSIMRDAATLVPDTILGQRIARDMSSLFTSFFMDDRLQDISPLDSVALYEEFQELVPAGEQGNKVIANLAEHMVQADLLDRAADLLQYQIDHRLSGDDAARTATRLAAINLIDKNPRDALSALNKALGFLRTLPEETATKSRFEELALLRARALSMDNKTDQALAIMENIDPNPDVNRLRADIAWQSGFWDDASYALEDVILDENISLTRPLIDEHAMLILQRAVAQNLSGDRIGLANLREKYGEALSQTNKARLFDVVTRPRQTTGLADRDTLLSTVAEIDLFGDFLNSYRDVNQQPSN